MMLDATQLQCSRKKKSHNYNIFKTEWNVKSQPCLNTEVIHKAGY